jgi:hypothetical protein
MFLQPMLRQYRSQLSANGLVQRRGICPSCGARRMAQTAAWLVDCVIPKVPVRQAVIWDDFAPYDC